MSVDKCYSCGQDLDVEGFCTNLNCKVTFNQRIDQQQTDTNNIDKTKTIKPKDSTINAYKNLDEPTKQIVMAQDRTTHAIRALVRFLFIQLSAITLAIIVGAFANGFDSEGLFVVAGLIYIIGVFWSSNAGWSELEKSNIPK